MSRLHLLPAAAVVAALAVPAGASAAPVCPTSSLALKTPGTLTIATDKPAYPPYFVDDKPANGKGFESAVAYAIAKQLGFSKSQVKWVVQSFNGSYAPGKKKFDFDVNQISINAARAKRVSFSTPYYTAPQAIVVPKGSKLKAKSLAGLRNAKIGVQLGTTSLDAVDSKIKPTQKPEVYNDSNDVVSALKQARIDAVVVDLPTAFYVTAAEVDGSKIIGQFSAPGGDTWGALLEKGSKLTACVDKAIAKLKSSGELGRITRKWMGAAAGAPKLD